MVASAMATPTPTPTRTKETTPRLRVKHGMTPEEVAEIHRLQREKRLSGKAAYNKAHPKPKGEDSDWNKADEATKFEIQKRAWLKKVRAGQKVTSAAAKKYGAVIPEEPPIQVPASQILGRRQRVEFTGTQASEVPTFDPDEPTNYAGFLAFMERMMTSKVIEDSTKRKYITDINRTLKNAYKITQPTLEKADVGKLLLAAPTVLAAVPSLPREKKSHRGSINDPLTASNLVNVYRALRFPINNWLPLQPNSATKNAYEAAYSKAQRDAEAEAAARPDIEPEDYNDILAAVHTTFPRDAKEQVIIDTFTVAPMRAEYGSLKIVDTDADMSRNDADKTNYLVKTHSGEGGLMTIVLRQYKNVKGRGESKHPIPTDSLAHKSIDAWLAAHPRNAYLFSQQRTPSKMVGNAQMSTWIGDMLSKALPEEAHASLTGQAVNALRKSWASTVTGVRNMSDPDIDSAMMNHSRKIHDKDYVRTLRIKPNHYYEFHGDTSDVRKATRGGPLPPAARDVTRKVKNAAPKRPASRPAPSGPQAPASSVGGVGGFGKEDDEVEQAPRQQKTSDPTLKAKLRTAIQALNAVRTSSRAGRGQNRRYA